MTPEYRLRARSRMYLDKALPAPGFWSAIEHGRRHHGDKEERAREWERLKAQGVKVGLSDIMIWYRGLFIGAEAKVKPNGPSDMQEKFGFAMWDNGFGWFCYYSITDLHDRLVNLGIPIAPSFRIEAMHHDATLQVAKEPKKKSSRPRKPRADPAALKVIARARARGIRV